VKRVKLEVEFAIIPLWLLTADVSAQAVRIYGVLARLGYKGRVPHPTHKDLAEAGRCSVATARRAVGELVALGAIEVNPRIDGRGRDSNEYLIKVNRPLLMGEQAGLFTDEQAPRSPVSTPKEAEKDLEVEKRSLSFDAFYEAFPRHEGKGAARKAYAKASTKLPPQALFDAALRYRGDPNREPGFTCLPATWLNQERWTDEPLPSRNGDKSAPVPKPRSRRISEFSDEELEELRV